MASIRSSGFRRTGAARSRARASSASGESSPSCRANAKLHVGLFEDTLPKFVADVPGQAAFVHIDCDIYSSTKTVFDHLADRISSGCVIVFDEYFNYPNWQQHEYKAFQEFVARRGIQYEYIGFAAKNGHVAVRIK